MENGFLRKKKKLKIYILMTQFIMAPLTKKLTLEKNAAITKLLAMQHELEEAQADIDILNKANVN